MLSSSCFIRACSLCGVKFLSRLLTALNLLPSMATTASREQPHLATQLDELPAHSADRLAVVLPKVGDRLEVRHQSAGEPDQLDVALGLTLQPPARLDAVEVPVDVDLQQRRRVVRRPAGGRQAARPQTPAPLRSSSSTKASTARTGLSSVIQSSSCSGNSTLCVRCSPSMNRLIRNSGRSTCPLCDAEPGRCRAARSPPPRLPADTWYRRRRGKGCRGSRCRGSLPGASGVARRARSS